MVRVLVASSWQGSANQVCLAARTARNGNRRHPLNRHDVGHCRTLPRPGGGFFLADRALVRPGGFPYIPSAPLLRRASGPLLELSCTELREISKSVKLSSQRSFGG